MDLSNLKPSEGSKKNKKRVGRGHGTGQGTQAGRGHKGAQSRSGYKFKRGFEGGQMPLHRRIPKRGFHNPFRVEYAVVNLDVLAERFEADTVVTPELLRERGLDPRRASADQGSRARGHVEEADGAGAQVQRQGGGEDCGGRWRGRGDRGSEVGGAVGPVVAGIYGERAQESLRDQRPAEPRAVHAGDCWACTALGASSRRRE